MHASDADNTDRNSPAAMSVDRLDFDLPEELIATVPPAHRQDARLLHVSVESGQLADRRMTDLPALVRPGDLLVLNNTKVLPAKFTSYRRTGGRIPGLFLEQLAESTWLVLLEGAGKVVPGEQLAIRIPEHAEGDRSQEEIVTAVERRGEGQWVLKPRSARPASEILDEFGEMPLPPYIIKRRTEEARNNEPTVGREIDGATTCDDRTRYQTVYASAPGAVAAPTAGLHLTPELLDACRQRGAETTEVTLHVGVGTFRPIKVGTLSEHRMHGERFDFGADAAHAVNECRARNGRVIAVGTTTVRVLETVAQGIDRPNSLHAQQGTTHAFIYPPYAFGCVDALITNFHLPRSTLIAMVMALAGEESVRAAYRHAVEERYRFFSYGDAMFFA